VNLRPLMMGTIRLARRLVMNTPVQRWPITDRVYRWVFRRSVPEDVVTREVHGVTLTFPTHDITVAPGLVGGFYEHLEVEAFVKLAARSRTIVDVGGNLGLYACLGGRALPADGALVTFEPVPDNLTFLRQNVAQNPAAGRVIVEPSAVGAHEGEVAIHLSPDNVGTHSVSARNVAAGADHVTVPVVTLDGYLAANGIGPVDLLKIDVEGYDGAVLQGAAATLEAGPSLFVEFGPGQLRNCGFDPGRFLDIVFGRYPTVLLVDESRRGVRPCTRGELAGFSAQKVYNLICVERPDHLAALAA
jgi:FkbM family methyltransferase